MDMKSSQHRSFWKPGTLAPGSNITREDAKDSGMIVFNSRKNLSLRQQRMLLPVYQSRRQILYAVEKFQVTVIVGQTGSGKTTQIPQFLHEAGWTAGTRMVACTQPRRVAATTVAERVAQEMHTDLGVEVGYAVRFDDKFDPYRTKIKYLTDGMLLRETMLDPLLTQYSVIMIDEAHERSLHTDIILGLLRKIKRKRTDLRIIIASATLDAQAFKNFFEDNRSKDPSKDNAVIVSVQGRQYPVEVRYSISPVRDYLRAAVETVQHIHKTQARGDIMVFLTGAEEIKFVVNSLNQNEDPGLRACPLYAGLPPKHQVRAFQRGQQGTRKVVVATNIAETSVTIDGIVYVVDCGFVKSPVYEPTSGVEQLLVGPISQASANQRAGRAGRVAPGVCYRLYTEPDFHASMTEGTVPEMQRTNLATVVLQLKALGIDDVVHFDFMSPPPVSLLANSLELLFALGALDEYCRLTNPVGTTLAEFPVEPRLGKMLLQAGEMGCAEEMLSIAAMLSVQNPWVTPHTYRANANAAKMKFTVTEGDHLTLLNVYTSYLLNKKKNEWCQSNYLDPRALKRAVEIRSQLLRYMKRFKVPVKSCTDDTDGPELIRKCVVCGYFSNAAQIQPSAKYKTVRGGQELVVHPSSVLHAAGAQWVVFHEVVLTSEKFMRDLCVIEPMWLSELAPHFYEYKKPTATGYDKVLKSVQAASRSRGQDQARGAVKTTEIQEDGRKVKHRRLF